MSWRSRVNPLHPLWSALGLATLVGLLGALAAQVPGQVPRVAHGIFHIRVEGKEIGREEFEIERRATEIHARGRLTLRAGGRKVEETTALTLSTRHEPLRYEWKRTQPAGQFLRVQFQDNKAALEFSSSGTDVERREFIFETAQVVILDNNFFHHYLFLLRHYDFSRGGVQSIRILIPQEALPGIVTLEDQGLESVNAGETTHTLRRVRVTTEDKEIWLWVDEQGKLVRLTVPEAKVEVVRTPS
ncbi:MAG: hypothetical protein ACE5H2_01120 [Terriglobia bacterium]